MSTQERFELALKFIQTLPKDGPVKPSNMQLLSFYALKKQIDSGKVRPVWNAPASFCEHHFSTLLLTHA